MSRSLCYLSAIILSCILLVWLSPLFNTEWFQWLTSGWQWLLTLTLLLPLASILAWHYWRRHYKSDHRVMQEDYLKSKRTLDNDWHLLWKTLNNRRIDSPYTLPWLMMLGAEGAGKTAWLMDTGFEKVTASTSSQKSGIIFWLGEHAVIVELAGHYYTRNKERLEEMLWQHLITLLKKKRPRRPLTGIIEVLSTVQLIRRQPSGLLELAQQMRWRLLELNRQFDMRIPTWFLLTQSDRLSGFAELFRRRSSQRQVQPWGFFMPEGYHRDQFQQAFHLCQQELANTLLNCLHHEKAVNIRQAQMRYVLQFSLLGERLRFFCEEIFQSRYGTPSPILKGIWFSSCGQSGNSINLLAAELARQHGFKVMLEQHQPPDNQSYFNQQFFSRIIFNDLGAGGESPTARRRWLFKNVLIISAMAMTLFAGLKAIWSGIEYNRELLAQQVLVTKDYSLSMKTLGNNPLLAEVIEPLEQLQLLNRLYQNSSQWFCHGALLDWKAAHAVQNAYQQQLSQKLIEPLSELLYQRLKTAETYNHPSLFDDLQYYLMLFKPKLRNNGSLNRHILYVLNQQQNLPRTRQTALNSLLNDAWSLKTLTIKPDKELVRRASNILINQVDEHIIYDHIRALPEYQGSIPIHDLFGNDFDSLFTLSGQQGQIALPRLYTHAAYRSLDLSATSALLKQGWANLKKIEVNSSDVSTAEMIRISKRVRELYFQDYIKAWHNLISRIELRPVNSLSKISQQITLLNSGNSSMIANIFNTIISETSLAEPLNRHDPLTLTKETRKIIPSTKTEKAAKITEYAQTFLPPSPPTVTPDNPAIVNQAFANYANYNLHTRLTPVLDSVQKELRGITEHYNQHQVLYSIAVAISKNEECPLSRLWELAASDDSQVKHWLNRLANQIWKQTTLGAGQYCQAQWQQNVTSLWSQNLKNRFPFASQEKSDASLADLSELFKPKGLLDQYIHDTLSPFIEKKSSEWSLKIIRGEQLPVSQTLLKQLSLIKHLQRQLFNADGLLQVHYRMRCTELTADATELSLRDSNGRFVYRHGPRLWQKRQWPMQESESFSIAMNDNQTNLFQQNYEGPWAWLRFIFSTRQWQTSDKLELRYDNKGYSATFELMFEQRGNPFTPELFRKIDLPDRILRSSQ